MQGWLFPRGRATDLDAKLPEYHTLRAPPLSKMGVGGPWHGAANARQSCRTSERSPRSIHQLTRVFETASYPHSSLATVAFLPNCHKL